MIGVWQQASVSEYDCEHMRLGIKNATGIDEKTDLDTWQRGGTSPGAFREPSRNLPGYFANAPFKTLCTPFRGLLTLSNHQVPTRRMGKFADLVAVLALPWRPPSCLRRSSSMPLRARACVLRSGRDVLERARKEVEVATGLNRELTRVNPETAAEVTGLGCCGRRMGGPPSPGQVLIEKCVAQRQANVSPSTSLEPHVFDTL